VPETVGGAGLLLMDVPSEYGGGGGDFRHEAVLYEELNRRGISGFGQGVHSIAAHYVLNYGSEEQKQRWLPRMASGELIGAFVTERNVARDPGVVPYISVSGIDAVIALAVEHGAEVVRDPFPEGDLWVADLRDPAGNVIGVWQMGGR